MGRDIGCSRCAASPCATTRRADWASAAGADVVKCPARSGGVDFFWVALAPSHGMLPMDALPGYEIACPERPGHIGNGPGAEVPGRRSQAARVNWAVNNRRQLLRQVWEALEAGTRRLDHPFRTAALATAGDTHPHIRTVILREVLPDRRLLVCHTDLRSPKAAQIRRLSGVQWHFYHPAERVQILASARARLRHLDEAALAAWRQTPLPSRMSYLTRHAPGTVLRRPADAWPPSLHGREPDRDLTEPGHQHFALLECTVHTLEFLRLDREAHRRVRFVWSGKGWKSEWLTP